MPTTHRALGLLSGGLDSALAAVFGLGRRQRPGGGCRLIDACLSSRLVDLVANDLDGAATPDDVALLRLGRHRRVTDRPKIVPGRDREGNRRPMARAGEP